MTRILTGMWLLLLVSLSLMVLLMGDFLSGRKHAELSSPAATPPLARGPRGYVADAGVGAVEFDRTAVPGTKRLQQDAASHQLSDDEPSDDGVGLDTMDEEGTTVPSTDPREAEADPQQLRADDAEIRPVALSPRTGKRPHHTRGRDAQSQKTSEAPIYQKKMKRRGLLGRSKASRRFGNRRLFVTR